MAAEAATRFLARPPTTGPHRGIEAGTLAIIHIFIAGQTAVDRLTQQGRQGVLRILSGTRIVQSACSGAGQFEGAFEFTVGKESGVTGDGGAVELWPDVAVEIDAQGVVSAVTQRIPLSFQQEVVGTAGFGGQKGQTPCRIGRAIWKMWY